MTAPRRPDGLETPVTPLTRRGDRRPFVQIGAIGVAAAIVVVAGLGLGEQRTPVWTYAPTSSGVAVASQRPSASALPTPSAPPEALPCAPASPLDPAAPRLRLWSDSNDRPPQPGLPGPGPEAFGGPTLPPTEPAPSGSGWIVPRLENGVLLPPGAELLLVAEEATCLAEVAASYGPARAADAGAEAVYLGRTVATSETTALPIGGLPEGDWVVRVSARVTMRDPGAASTPARVSEPIVRFYRVVAGSQVVLAPSPQVTPAVACAGDVPGTLPEVVLLVHGGTPIVGGSAEAPAAVPPVRLGERLEVRVVGDRCARGWTVGIRDTLGNSFLQESYPNPVDNPFIAAQNRWLVNQLLVGDTTITATIRFGADREVDAAWAVRVETDALPAVVARSADGAAAVPIPGCGEFWQLEADVTAFEPCDVQTTPDEIETLTVAEGTVVHVAAEGWTVRSWFTRCGVAIADATGAAVFRTEADCNLGSSDDGGAIAFVPWPGERIVLLGLTLAKDGVNAYGNYFVRIVAEPAGGSFRPN